jgi:hypothetical protein
MDDPDAPVDLVVVPSELAAAPLLTLLNEHGIRAQAFTLGILGFWGNSPLRHRIVVRRRDLESARALLEQYQRERATFDPEQLDWAQVDTGDPTPIREHEAMPPRRLGCAQCGYETTGRPIGSRCPECGAMGPQTEMRAPAGSGRAGRWILAMLILLVFVMLVIGLVF